MACGRSRPKREMIRIVRTPDGDIVIDETGKASGRGAYICPARSCWEKVLQDPRLLGRTLKTNISPASLELLAAYAERLPSVDMEAAGRSIEKGRSDEDQVVRGNE